MVARTLDELLGELLTDVAQIKRRLTGAGGGGVPPRLAADLTTLSAGTDLNAITSTGWYLQSANANATLALNYPAANRAGHLTVSGSTEGSDFVLQTYTDYENQRQWSRTFYSGLWQPWNETIRTVNSALTTIRLPNTTDVSLTSTGHAFQIGVDSGQNMAVDNNEFQSRLNGVASGMSLNAEGGDMTLGDAVSRINIPSLRQAWHVAHSAAQSLASGSFVRITSWTTIYQVGSMTYSAGVFTVPVDGIYLVHGQVRTVSQATSVGQRTCRLVFTGTGAGNIEGLGNAASAGISGGAEITQVRRMAAGDTVAFEAFQSHGSAINTITGDQFTNFAIDLLIRL